VLDSGGLIGELKKALAERMLNAEMDVHLEQPGEAQAGNHRNGTSAKTVLTPEGELTLSIPRDRHGRFDPALIAKYRRRFPGFDDKIIALYARGMSTRDIQAHVREIYGVEISPDLVSAVTDAVIDEVGAWQARPLEPTYAIVFFDALRVKIRDEGLVKNKAVYLAIGMRPSGHKEVLGLWIEQSEGAKFWLRVMNEIRGRGTHDILIAVVDGRKGFPEAITAVFPDTVVQNCIVGLLNNPFDRRPCFGVSRFRKQQHLLQRAVVELLRAGPARVGDLARTLAVSAPRMSQHLRALRRSGVVEESGIEGDARVRLHQLRREPFAALRSWSEGIESSWTVELEAFRRHAVQRRGKRR